MIKDSENIYFRYGDLEFPVSLTMSRTMIDIANCSMPDILSEDEIPAYKLAIGEVFSHIQDLNRRANALMMSFLF